MERRNVLQRWHVRGPGHISLDGLSTQPPRDLSGAPVYHRICRPGRCGWRVHDGKQGTAHRRRCRVVHRSLSLGQKSIDPKPGDASCRLDPLVVCRRRHTKGRRVLALTTPPLHSRMASDGTGDELERCHEIGIHLVDGRFSAALGLGKPPGPRHGSPRDLGKSPECLGPRDDMGCTRFGTARFTCSVASQTANPNMVGATRDALGFTTHREFHGLIDGDANRSHEPV